MCFSSWYFSPEETSRSTRKLFPGAVGGAVGISEGMWEAIVITMVRNVGLDTLLTYEILSVVLPASESPGPSCVGMVGSWTRLFDSVASGVGGGEVEAGLATSRSGAGMEAPSSTAVFARDFS